MKVLSLEVLMTPSLLALSYIPGVSYLMTAGRRVLIVSVAKTKFISFDKYPEYCGLLVGPRFLGSNLDLS